MGIIARQSSKKTIVSFIGVLIGALSILFIYPNDKEIYGLALFLFSSANLLMILLSMGSLGLVLKYFPVFQNKKIPGFFSLITIIIFSSVIFVSLFILLLKPGFYEVLGIMKFDVETIKQHSLSIFILGILLVIIYLLVNHSTNLKRIVVPSIIFELGHKLALPVLVLLVFSGIIGMSMFKGLYLAFFALALIFMIIYVAYLGGLKFENIGFSAIKKPMKREMLVYMLFSGLNQIGANIVARVDTIMVATMISLTDTGIYGILLFMANVIDIPVRSINQIAGPVISSSLENKDLQNVENIYKKSSINSLVVGVFIFILIWGLLYNIFQIMPKNDSIYDYKNVFLFLALGKLIDMGFSTNTHIIIYSKYFKYNLVFVLSLGLVNLILNYFLITKYGITGAAMASAISLALYNILKFVFIQVKFKFWPFTLNTLKLFVIGVIMFFILVFLPDFFLDWPDLFIKGIIICILYYALLKIFRIRAEVLEEGEMKAKEILNKIRNKQ